MAHDVLAAGEGLETMLSLRTVLPSMPMIAHSRPTTSPHLLPAGPQRLYVAIDDDPAGRRAMEALRARDDLHGLELRQLIPSEGDFKEDLQ